MFRILYEFENTLYIFPFHANTYSIHTNPQCQAFDGRQPPAVLLKIILYILASSFNMVNSPISVYF